MNVVYADDDQLSLEIVLRALESRGHTVIAVNSSKMNDMLVKFQQLLTQGPVPQMIILDGHNIAKDPDGKPVADVQPTVLMGWLHRNGLDAQTPFVLYSSDDAMVEKYQADPSIGFFAAVPKVGVNGGLSALLKVVESLPKS